MIYKLRCRQGQRLRYGLLSNNDYSFMNNKIFQQRNRIYCRGFKYLQAFQQYNSNVITVIKIRRLNTFNVYFYSNQNNANKQSQSQTKSETQPQPQSQQQQKFTQQQQQKQAKISAKQQLRLQKLKQMQQQQIRAINDRVNLTQQSYSPFIQYLKLYKFQLGMLLLLFLPGWLIYKFVTMAGVWVVEQMEQQSRNQQIQAKNKEIKKKKKLSLISRQYQQKIISPYINKLFLNYNQQLPTQHISQFLKSKLSSITQKLPKIFPQSTSQFTLKLIENQQPIILCLPNNNIILSRSLARSQLISQQQLQFLIVLANQLYKQGYHLRNISPLQVPTFWNMELAGNQIKLRQIYTIKYKRNQILKNIDIVLQKYVDLNYNINYETIKKVFENLEKINQEYSKGKKIQSQENIYRRLYKYYILVKVQ